jgi:hypothetical protein
LSAFLVWAVPAGDQRAEEISDAVLGDERYGRRDLPAEEASELFGRIGDEFAVALQDRGGIVDPVEHRAAHDVTNLVQLKLEAGDDTEVTAAAAQRPEQVFVLAPRRSCFDRVAHRVLLCWVSPRIRNQAFRKRSLSTGLAQKASCRAERREIMTRRKSLDEVPELLTHGLTGKSTGQGVEGSKFQPVCPLRAGGLDGTA